jgi:hypothetical protein
MKLRSRIVTQAQSVRERWRRGASLPLSPRFSVAPVVEASRFLSLPRLLDPSEHFDRR